MATRIIRALAATLSDDTEVVQGQEVQLSAEDEARLEEQRALVPSGFGSWAEFDGYMQDAYRSGRGDLTAAGKLAEARSGGIADLSQLAAAGSGAEVEAAWLQANSPTVDEVIERAGDDPVKAQHLLDAEGTVTGHEPRKGVVDGLTRIIEQE